MTTTASSASTPSNPGPARTPRRVRPTTLAAAVAATAALVLGGCGASSSPVSTPAPSASGSVITVPLQVLSMSGATLALVPVTINGRGPYPFVLDTGASSSAVSRQLANQLGLQQTGRSSTVSGVTATQQVPLVRVANWKLGTVALPASSVGALDFPSAQSGSGSGSSTSGGGIAGLLGSDQLSRFGSVTVDYQREQLRFEPRSGR